MDFDTLITKYLTKTATENEKKQLENLLNCNPELRKTYDILREYWEQNKPIRETPYEEAIWKRLKENTLPSRTSNSRSKLSGIYQYAAALVIVILSVALFWENTGNLLGEEKVEISYITKQNPVRVKRAFVLPDGTKVHLNSQSKITYPNVFMEERVVKLTGEAYFDVVSDPEKLFKVQCQNTSTTVRGTSFNIRGYQDEEIVKVSLVEGKVSVDFNGRDGISSYLLEPTQEAVYHKTSGEVSVDHFNRAEITSWKDGILYFRNASFERVKSKIERWYGVEVSLSKGKVPQWNISGEFHNESLHNVMEAISHAANFEFIISDSRVEIILP